MLYVGCDNITKDQLDSVEKKDNINLECRIEEDTDRKLLRIFLYILDAESDYNCTIKKVKLMKNLISCAKMDFKEINTFKTRINNIL